MSDIITIGSATVDVFVHCDEANIVSVCAKDKMSSFMSYPYGAKIDITEFASTIGGGGLNTAVNFAHLGFDTSPIFKIGEDIYAKGILEGIKDKGLDLSNIIIDKNSSTGLSIILVTFQGDRTVLAHRGANSEIKKSDIDFEMIRNAKFVYVAPLNGESNKVLAPIVDFANKNDVKVCFNAGTTSIKKGFGYLEKIFNDAFVVVMNKEEAMMSTKIHVRPDNAKIKFSEEVIHPDIKTMLELLRVRDYQVVVITDGGNGAYAYDGLNYYKCPVFNGEVVSTLGAGDAFASTFCASMCKNNFDISKSLMCASVNSASIVSKFGATEGLLTFDEINRKLIEYPNYTCIKM